MRHLGGLLLALAALTALVGAPAAFVASSDPVLAQDGKGKGKGGGKDKDGKGGGKGDDKGGKDDKEKPEDTAEWRKCAAIGRAFAAADAAGVVGHMAGGDAKLKLELGESGDYARVQAQEILAGWFKNRSGITAEMKSLNDLTGTLNVSWRQAGSEKRVSGTLYVTLRRERDRGLVLARLLLSS